MKQPIVMIRAFILIVFLAVIPELPAKSLTIACDDEWPPYEYIDDGQLTGFAVEVVRHVLDAMGIDYTITNYPWKRAESMVLNGDADGLFPASPSKTREAVCHYTTEPLLDSVYFFYIRKIDAGRLTFETFEDLRKGRIGVTSGYTYTEAFWEFLKSYQRYDEVRTDELNLRKLHGNRVDYIPLERGTAAILLNKTKLSEDITYLPKPLLKKPYYMIFNKKNVDNALVDQFSETLKAFKETDPFRRLELRFLGE